MHQQEESQSPPPPPPEPPTVKVIECSCSQADQRSPDFSTWTNIFNEPIEVKKGSEIRIVQSFIDMRGMDSDIIQFQSKGDDRDNSHTMLFQHYTTNDGFNNKTCSYDYISNNDPSSNTFRIPLGGIMDPGEGYKNTLGYNIPFQPSWTTDGDGINFTDGIVETYQYCIRPKNITIVDQGRNYTNGERFTITAGPTPTSDDFYGYIGTDDIGSITSVTFTKPFSKLNPGAGPSYTLNFFQGTNGIDGEINITITYDGVGWTQFLLPRDNVARGKHYRVGDTIFPMEQDNTTTPVPVDKRASFQVTNVFIGPGGINNDYYYDIGYNYERSLVYRWAQTFDVNFNFCYGNNLDRTFVFNDETISIDVPASYHLTDPGISAGNMIMAKEDEFVSGIFHTPSDKDEFKLLSPVIELLSSDTFSVTINKEEGIGRPGWVLTIPNSYQPDFPGTMGNDLNVMAPGSCWQFYFEYVHSPVTPAELISLKTTQFNWGNTMRVKSVKTSQTGTNVLFDSDLENTEFFGEVTAFSNLAGVGGFPAFGSDNYTLTLMSSDVTTPIPPTPPILYVKSDGSGNVTTTTIIHGGEGNYKGNVYSVGGISNVVVTQVDGVHGWDFSENMTTLGLDNTDLVIGGNNVRLSLIPVGNWSRFGSRGNSLQFGNQRVNPEPGRFPVKFTTQAPTKNTVVSNYLFRPAGNYNVGSKEYRVVNHDKNLNTIVSSELTPLATFVSPTTGLEYYEISMAYGTTGLYGYNDGVPNTYWCVPGTDYWILRLSKSAIAQDFLPINRFVDIVGYDGITPIVECQVQVAGLGAEDVNYWYLEIISPDIVNNNWCPFTTSTAARTHTNIPNIAKQPVYGFSNNLNNHGLTSVTLYYAADPKSFNTSIDLKWNNSTGSIALTGEQNFFNINDVNYNTDRIQNIIIPNTSNDERNSYNEGGYYFLSSHSTVEEDHFVSYNSGYDFFLSAQVQNKNYISRNSGIVPNPYNNNRVFTDIGRIWNYEPLLRQKTITMTKDFCSPSDISGIWVRQAHKLGGALSPVDGKEYVSSEFSGILQNEFLMPVYGASNKIGLDGKYVLDSKYNESGGLEPGHSKGISYVSSDNNWIPVSMLLQLPVDSNGKTYFDVFFRSGMTTLRGYDPLKSDTTQTDLPDKSFLTTVNTDAGSCGNTGIKTLAGDGPLPGKGTQIYELGPATGGTANFDRTSFFPINYLDPTKNSLYPKAKLSQFVGTQNPTLAFDVNVSSFTFQYLHTPYTSPFIDGQGGSESVRVFYGNRLNGIVNHETVGGVVVQNYCRPFYPRGIFSQDEIETNIVMKSFPYGVSPTKGTGNIGRRFLNKLGFIDSDLGILTNTGKILDDNTQLGVKRTEYSTRLSESLTDGTPYEWPQYIISSYNSVYQGTTGGNLDVSDGILTQVPAPETSPGIESYNIKTIPKIGKSRVIIQKFGDQVFYPYSVNNDTNSFNQPTTGGANIIRYDNASTTYGTIGGLKYSNSNRGMGLPNTLGSTMLCDNQTIPVTLNPDCELYLAYTISTTSSKKKASLLPVKLANAYLIVLSSLFKQPNLYMSKTGFINGGSIVNKTFITGDFILSDGLTSFYAPEDMILTNIETQIKDSNFSIPSTLGINSSVIYSITNYNPTPSMQFPTIGQQQQQDMAIMELVNQHMNHPETSKLEQLHQDFYALGLDLITNQTTDIIDAVRNQINAHDLPGMTPEQKVQFLRTSEGKILLSNVADVQAIREHISNIDMYQNTPSEYSVTRRERGNIQARRDAILKRTPIYYFQRNEDPEDETPRPDPLLHFSDQLPQRLTPYGPTEPPVHFEESPELEEAMGKPLHPVLAEYIDRGKGNVLPEDLPHARQISERSITPKAVKEKLKSTQERKEEKRREKGREELRTGPINIPGTHYYTPEELEKLEDYATYMGYGRKPSKSKSAKSTPEEETEEELEERKRREERRTGFRKSGLRPEHQL